MSCLDAVGGFVRGLRLELHGRDPGQCGKAGGRRFGDAADDDREAVGTEAAQELLGRRGPDELPVVEDRDVIRDALDVVEDVGRIEVRGIAPQPLHDLEHVPPSDGVERACRLIEQEQPRPADEGLRIPSRWRMPPE